MGDRLAVDFSLTPARLRPGEAAVMRISGEWLAVRRDPDGRLSALAAECTHSGCLVAWNAPDGTWDCGCHGSRYSTAGEPLAGPARAPLAPRSLPATPPE